MKHYSQNTKNDDDYIYDIDFEKYVDKIVNSDDEINVIIIEKEFYDKDHIYNSSLPNNNTRIVYHKGSIYTHKNNLNRNYASRNNLNRNNNIDSSVKKVSFSNEIKIIDDQSNTFRENNNFNQCNDDVRNKKFNDFIPKGKYVFSYK